MFLSGNECPNCGNTITILRTRGNVSHEVTGWLDQHGEVEIDENIDPICLMNASEYKCPICNERMYFYDPSDAVEWLNKANSNPNSRDVEMINLLNSLSSEENDHLEEVLGSGSSSFEKILSIAEEQRIICETCNEIYNKLTLKDNVSNKNYERGN